MALLAATRLAVQRLSAHQLQRGFAAALCQHSSRSFASVQEDDRPLTWVFLGPPGVGKGTYATRVANAFGMCHIAAGDLVRDEIKSGSELGKEMAKIVNQGHLLPDGIIMRVLREHFMRMHSEGTDKFLLDGFPRTEAQAKNLEVVANVQLALNLALREEVLVEKCLGRRICKKCGKNYNIADIYLPASDGRPEIVMPPLSPPEECVDHLEQRSDDTEPVVRKRLEVYKSMAEPVEAFYRGHGTLRDFEITGGIPETLPRLLEMLVPFMQEATEAAKNNNA